MRFQLDHETNKKLDYAIKAEPDILNRIFKTYAKQSDGMNEEASKTLLTTLLANEYTRITK